MTTEIDKRAAGQRQLSFAELTQQATATFDTGMLEKDKALFIGVPLVITRLTYRPVVAGPDGNPQRGYVSCEATIGDTQHLEQAIRRGWIPYADDLSAFPFAPEESVVFNDGGTGIRRSVTAMLHAQGRINIGTLTGENKDFDRPWVEWESFDSVGTQKLDSGEKIEIPDFYGIIVHAVHGLRASNFDAFGQPATTYYLS